MLVLVVLLAAFGLAVLFSASEYNGRVRFGDSAYYFKKQLFATALGLCAMYAVSNMDYHFSQDCAGSISAFHDFVYGSTSGRAGNQWLKEMAEPGPIVFSAV